MRPPRIAAGAFTLALVAWLCVGGGAAPGEPSTATASGVPPTTSAPYQPLVAMDAPPPTVPDFAPRPTEATTTPTRSPLADLVRPVGGLTSGLAPPAVESAPVSVDIEGIGVAGASVRAVGVRADGEMEIPGADEIGWYRWSPSPGGHGSAVLAAHIALDGRDGVFRRLADVDVGDRVGIGYDDGSTREFTIVEVAQYDKDELPDDRIFAKDGDPVVALITCGGTFNTSLRSYDDNVVAYAVPA